MLVLRCYSFCTVLDSPRWLVQSVLRRESSGLASGSSGRAIGGRSKKQEQEESVLHTGALFLNSQIWPAHRRLLESACPCGAEPRLHNSSCKAHDHSSSDI